MTASARGPSTDGAKTSSTKRTPYVANACNECKRRKLKCDGELPCQRCLAQSSLCNYRQHRQRRGKVKGSTRATRSKQKALDDQQCNANTRDEGIHISDETFTSSSPASRAVSKQQLQTPPQAAEFCGPSSSEFTLNVVNGNLKAMGISDAIGRAPDSVPGTFSNTSFRPGQYGPFMKMLTMDPLWDLKRNDAVRLISDYCYGPGSLYPVVDHQQMLKTADKVFQSLESAQGGSITDKGVSAAEAIFSDETNKLKLIIAIGRTIECGGRNDQAQRLFQSITQAVEGLLWNLDGINGIQLLVLVAQYHYHLDEEVRTWRIISFASRLCLEMGLHRREMVFRTFRKVQDRNLALKVFWSVYMLERRTSLGLGIPFSLQDSHIDPSLFTVDISSPFMTIMIEWSKLAGKTWQALNGQGEKDSAIPGDELEYLDYQIIQWYEHIPNDLKLQQDGSNRRESTVLEGQDPTYIPAILYLRKAHLRNLIYRPTLQSASRIAENKRYGLMAIQVAKESIQTLSELNRTTKHITAHALFFKHLLLTAFGNLLLAVVNATSDFWDDVRDEFHSALGLIKLLSARSGPLMRLWQRLKGLEGLHTRMLLSSTHHPPNTQPRQITVPPTAPDFLTIDLPATFPVISEMSERSGVAEYSIGGPQMRDEFANLFDTSLNLDYFSDFPFVDFGNTT